jgi:hypothetical protein
MSQPYSIAISLPKKGLPAPFWTTSFKILFYGYFFKQEENTFSPTLQGALIIIKFPLHLQVIF